MATTVVWLQQDLRLSDHPALTHAAQRGAVVPLYIWSPEEHGAWPPGGAHRWWLHHSLSRLSDDLKSRTSQLILRRGPSLEVLRAVVAECSADAVCWHTRYAPALRERDAKIADALTADGCTVRTFQSRILHDPDEIRTGSGTPYRVFTPFWRKFQQQLSISAPLGRPRLGQQRAPATWPRTEALDDLGLTPIAQDGVDWAEDIAATWTPGEDAAQRRLARFTEEILLAYPDQRNRPDRDGTSRLSPYLHHGEISPRQVWHAVQAWIQNGVMKEAATSYLSEIAWREFSYHLLYHYPQTPQEPLREKFAAFSWSDDSDALRRWQRGQTGFPIVDAGMRQLWATGWMHNRVRMITASFLTKDLLIPWQEGAHWFWDTLVDADLANNTMGWQWSAGSGADAQPFFRIFNPVSQGQRFDPKGAYVRQWVPELKALPDQYLHQPWEAPASVLEQAGVSLGETYPAPIVDHAEARDRALAAYQQIK